MTFDPEVADILRTARQHGPVVLVTNATTRLESDADRLGLADHVDAIVNSARLHAAKPDPRSTKRRPNERAYRHTGACSSTTAPRTPTRPARSA